MGTPSLATARRFYLISSLTCVLCFYLWRVFLLARLLGFLFFLASMPWSCLFLCVSPARVGGNRWPLQWALDASVVAAGFSVNATLTFILLRPHLSRCCAWAWCAIRALCLRRPPRPL